MEFHRFHWSGGIGEDGQMYTWSSFKRGEVAATQIVPSCFAIAVTYVWPCCNTNVADVNHLIQGQNWDDLVNLYG